MKLERIAIKYAPLIMYLSIVITLFILHASYTVLDFIVALIMALPIIPLAYILKKVYQIMKKSSIRNAKKNKEIITTKENLDILDELALTQGGEVSELGLGWKILSYIYAIYIWIFNITLVLAILSIFTHFASILIWNIYYGSFFICYSILIFILREVTNIALDGSNVWTSSCCCQRNTFYAPIGTPQ